MAIPKYIRLMSDLHLNVDANSFRQTRLLTTESVKIRDEMDLLYVPTPLPEDRDTILVIAGDFWSDGRFYSRLDKDGISWISKISKNFHSVVMVLGNHDYWGCKLDKEPNVVKQALLDQSLSNCYLLENDTVIIGNVKFVGATLWTSFNNGHPLTMMIASGHMNDYKYIIKQTGPEYHKVKPRDILEKYIRSKEYIFNNTNKDHDGQMLIVVTHMAPSNLSVHEKYKNSRDDESNFLYYSDLGIEVCYSEIDYWFHGHMHDPFNYKLGDTTVICNPRGYAGMESNKFDETLRIDIKQG